MGETEENEFVADDWATLQRLLFRDSWNEDLGRHRSPYVFRGMTDTDHDLRTSLQRFVSTSEQWDLEVHLLRNFRQYARQDIDQPKSPFHLMALAQHHGLPTRLLDGPTRRRSPHTSRRMVHPTPTVSSGRLITKRLTSDCQTTFRRSSRSWGRACSMRRCSTTS